MKRRVADGSELKDTNKSECTRCEVCNNILIGSPSKIQ